MNNIRWIIDGYRYWDKTNGNSYYLTRLTHVGTGKSIMLDECEGNVRSIVAKVDDTYCPRVHTSPIQDIPCREWRRMRNSKYHAPVSQYERKGTKCINISTKLVRRLRAA